jgi:hypothetical protein
MVGVIWYGMVVGTIEQLKVRSSRTLSVLLMSGGMQCDLPPILGSDLPPIFYREIYVGIS